MPDAEHVRRIYNKRASQYDAIASRQWVESMRADLFKQARGDVLELGVGTGATFQHYPPDLNSLTGLDISEGMLAIAKQKAAALPFPVTLQIADYQTLPFGGSSFDTVACSLALCGIPDPAQLFAEIKRVLRPDGSLLAIEHIRPPNPFFGILADLLDPLNRHFVGCHLNRRTPDLLRASGYKVSILDRHMLRSMVTLVATP